MSILDLLLIAIGLSMDAFAVSICKGLALRKISWKSCAICGLWFGGFQALMPLLGYLVGYKTQGGKEYRCLSKKVGVTINDLKGEIKAEDSAEFTVTLDHEGSTGTGILTFGDKNSEIEYKDKNGAYQPMPKDPKDGLEVDLSGNNKNYEFRITPKDAGEQTLTAAVVRDAVELGTADKDYTVAGRVHTAVTLEGLEDAVI